MKNITVLGAGLVGKAIAIDLSSSFKVVSVDQREDVLEQLKKDHPSILTVATDLSKPENIVSVIKNADLVVGCMPGFMGFETIKTVLNEGKNIVDISFFPENMFLLDRIARDHDVTCVVDCGVAPGMGNIILGYHNERMKVANYKCVVGGLPKTREWPFEYKAVFSPIDVIEEYIRPARYIENDTLLVKEALSDSEHLFFPGVGTLEAWNSDGLRSLLKTMPNIPNMIEKTMRYPGTIEYLKVLRESGYFSYDPVEINGNMIRPIDLTSKLLFPKWQLKPGEEDMTIMRIIIDGKEDSVYKRYTYDLFDSFDLKTNTLSMARTTGYTCSAAAHLVANGRFSEKGICPPEFLGKDENDYSFILNYLKERNVIYDVKVENI
ncbi:MAG: saccharopine dehydrogenase NADP-binding domain-containing protein [Saprospiraceae bacterium]|nr:saccharopine dehydrogenase NADP-binding domain-containing protein [Saprospiraceae bacterium]